ncbi:MAG: hypothetical protein AB7E24_07860 [Novosphingobium sp.]
MTSGDHDHAELSQAERETGQMIWLRAAPRMTRLATIVIRLRVARNGSVEGCISHGAGFVGTCS